MRMKMKNLKNVSSRFVLIKIIFQLGGHFFIFICIFREINYFGLAIFLQSLSFLFFVKIGQFFEKLGSGFHDVDLVTSTFGTKPFAFGFGCHPHTIEMEPFDGTEIVVTANHFSIRYLKTKLNIRKS